MIGITLIVLTLPHILSVSSQDLKVIPPYHMDPTNHHPAPAQNQSSTKQEEDPHKVLQFCLSIFHSQQREQTFVVIPWNEDDYITTWIDVRNLQSLRQIYLTLSEKLNIPIMDDENDFRCAVLARISEVEQNLWIKSFSSSIIGIFNFSDKVR
jgi:hypothetical protein